MLSPTPRSRLRSITLTATHDATTTREESGYGEQNAQFMAKPQPGKAALELQRCLLPALAPPHPEASLRRNRPP